METKLTELESRIVRELENLVGQRFTLYTLTQKICEIFHENIVLIETNYEDDDFTDWCYLFESIKEETYGFFEVYFLKMRTKGFDGSDIYIAEINCDFESQSF
jgi:hypothetical protein